MTAASLPPNLLLNVSESLKLDRNGSGGGMLVHVRVDIPLKLLATVFSNREGFY